MTFLTNFPASMAASASPNFWPVPPYASGPFFPSQFSSVPPALQPPYYAIVIPTASVPSALFPIPDVAPHPQHPQSYSPPPTSTPLTGVVYRDPELSRPRSYVPIHPHAAPVLPLVANPYPPFLLPRSGSSAFSAPSRAIAASVPVMPPCSSSQYVPFASPSPEPQEADDDHKEMSRTRRSQHLTETLLKAIRPQPIVTDDQIQSFFQRQFLRFYKIKHQGTRVHYHPPSTLAGKQYILWSNPREDGTIQVKSPDLNKRKELPLANLKPILDVGDHALILEPEFSTELHTLVKVVKRKKYGCYSVQRTGFTKDTFDFQVPKNNGLYHMVPLSADDSREDLPTQPHKIYDMDGVGYQL